MIKSVKQFQIHKDSRQKAPLRCPADKNKTTAKKNLKKYQENSAPKSAEKPDAIGEGVAQKAVVERETKLNSNDDKQKTTMAERNEKSKTVSSKSETRLEIFALFRKWISRKKSYPNQTSQNSAKKADAATAIALSNSFNKKKPAQESNFQERSDEAKK